MTISEQEIFYLRVGEADATGYPVDDGFIVKEGSIVRNTISDSLRGNFAEQRQQLLDEGVLVEHGEHLRFTCDHKFKTPSGAGAFVKGTPSNGWHDWKNSDGISLNRIMRVSVDAADTTLPESMISDLQAVVESARDQGGMLSQSEIQRHYELFRQKFGPDQLSARDGEELLEFMHDHGRPDSLVYWIEFKSDDEFKTKELGSISGGSALKFRVFRRKETGNWQAANDRNKPVDIPIEEAIQIARDHRQQLIAGCEVLQALPSDADDNDYAKLQDDLDAVAPDVSRLAWGHKYFSLLFPDKLDDYHARYIQRFHLLKLKQMPPLVDGRYVCAGRFVSAAKQAGLSIYELTSALNVVHGRWHRYWRIGTRSGSDNTSHWEMMKDLGVVAVGWKDLGDLSELKSNRESRDYLKTQIAELDPDRKASSVGRIASQLINFVNLIGEGDVVVACDGREVLAVGRVSGEYSYQPVHGFAHHRPVEWVDISDWKMPLSEGLRSTVRELGKYDENIVSIEAKLQDGTIENQPQEASPARAARLRLSGVPGRIQSTLDRKGQVILYGPPGTGKTFWAQRAAKTLAAHAAFGIEYSGLDDQQRAAIDGTDTQPGCVRMCCFHPAYGYEDFLEGYRPQSDDGQMSFELRPGVFKRICNDASEHPERKFYLIVDEINRGDIPRAFGELLTVLEKDKRDKAIVLPVSQEPFRVAKNVYLIGTMNTADRSISLLDAALRRRFGFIEMMPDSSVLGDSELGGLSLKAWFEALNERIRTNIGRDARNLQIGHSYLMQGGRPISDVAVLARALRDDIIPLIEDYCYEDYSTIATLLGEGLVDTQKQAIKQHLFEQGREDALIDVLAGMFPDQVTSTAAISADQIDDSDEATDDDDAELDDAQDGADA